MLRFFETLNFTNTDEITLSKCPDCNRYFFDRDCIGSCCKEKTTSPVNGLGTALMKFLADRKD